MTDPRVAKVLALNEQCSKLNTIRSGLAVTMEANRRQLAQLQQQAKVLLKGLMPEATADLVDDMDTPELLAAIKAKITEIDQKNDEAIKKFESDLANYEANLTKIAEALEDGN